MVKLLTSQGANVKFKDKQGYTPLHAAAVSGQLDVVKYLLKVVSEVNDNKKNCHHRKCIYYILPPTEITEIRITE